MLSFQTNQSQNPVNSSITNEKINKEEVPIKEASYEKVKEIKIDITLNEEVLAFFIFV